MTFSWSIETYQRLTSTQEEIKDRLNLASPNHAHEGLVIQAIEQTAGRGRQGRLWFSPPGNLYMSIFLEPGCPLSQGGTLSLVISLSVSRALEKLYSPDPDFVLKWPNDVLHKGKKCAGILLETETNDSGALQHVIAGIGVNLVSSPPETGIALNTLGQTTISLTELRDTILTCLLEDYQTWRSEGFTQLREQWLQRSIPPGTPIAAGPENARISGKFKTIDEAGNLVITDTAGQDRVLASGEILQH